jgi:hypothetical protein
VPDGRLVVDPHLPSGLSRLRLDRMWLGDDRVSLDVSPGGVHVEGLPAHLVVAPGRA